MAHSPNMYNTNEFEVYRNEERRIPPGITTFRIPIIDRNLYNSPSPYIPEGQSIEQAISPPVSYLELNKYRASMHISYDILQNQFGINLGFEHPAQPARNDLERLVELLRVVSRETDARLKQLQPVDEGHPIILEYVRVINQWEANGLILIDTLFWAIQVRDADLGKSVFERTLMEVLSGQFDGTITQPPYGRSPLPYLDPHDFHLINSYGKGYKDDAEENAHELLKSMITKEQFELYKNDGYVEIKGTYGRIYKVRKGNMIVVTQERKGSKKKEYRLCLEPRDYGTICPTDEVIAKIRLIKASEKKLHKIGNKFDDGQLNITINSSAISNATIDVSQLYGESNNER